MPRTLDPAAHAVRRDAFVDSALRLIQARGYEQLSIQDVLDDTEASKGAFYHYFDSKAALLAAVVERTVEASTSSLEPIVDDPGLSALQKLSGVFSGIAQWKGERTDLMLELLRVWLSDDNAVVRERLRRAVSDRLTPVLETIVRQGLAEGTFSVSSPEGVAEVFVALILGLNESASRMYVARRVGSISFQDVQRTVAAYVESFERILGIPATSWPLVDESALRQWFD
ncbi:MAG TPA: TetR/AcrR family transcriptional regulator [Candidatus Acidoferrales bacterium]|nr:TetR/AcrR family transcriptional regulator [Candidatus Acidoferrales bacterium]